MVMSITLLVVFLLLMFLGVPIAISLGAASVFTIVTMSSLPLSMWRLWWDYNGKISKNP